MQQVEVALPQQSKGLVPRHAKRAAPSAWLCFPAPPVTQKNRCPLNVCDVRGRAYYLIIRHNYHQQAFHKLRRYLQKIILL